jgi:predicted alpha/beta hydrolase
MTLSNASQAAAAETLILNPRDGFPVTALRYAARGPVRGHLVVAGATGVRQLFYKVAVSPLNINGRNANLHEQW